MCEAASLLTAISSEQSLKYLNNSAYEEGIEILRANTY